MWLGIRRSIRSSRKGSSLATLALAGTNVQALPPDSFRAGPERPALPSLFFVRCAFNSPPPPAEPGKSRGNTASILPTDYPQQLAAHFNLGDQPTFFYTTRGRNF